MLGILLTKWTVRLSLLGYATYVASALALPADRYAAGRRWLWTIAGGLFAIHVTCAFHFYHHWSHAHAWQTTADETERLLGVPFGDGIYFSYAFLAMWLADIAWQWVAGSAARCGHRSAITVPPRALGTQLAPWVRGATHAFLFFIAFHGAIVFENGPTRPVGIAVCCILAGLAVLKWHRAQSGRAKSDRPPTNLKTSPDLSDGDRAKPAESAAQQVC